MAKIALVYLVLFVMVVLVSKRAHASLAAAVTTYHYDNARTGVNSHEYALTPNINSSNFGRLKTVPVDADIYTQPLYVPSVAIPGKGWRNVVYVVTANNSLYAIDADFGIVLWKDSLGGAASGEYDCNGYVGIFGTPVIDTITQTIFLVTKSNNPPQQKLYAIDIRSGKQRRNPVIVTGSAAGNGYGSVGGLITFDPTYQVERSALLLYRNRIIVTEAVLCDGPPGPNVVPAPHVAHGWLFAYDENLVQRGTFLSSPNGYDSDFWASGGGPAANDSELFVSTGNGDFNPSETDWGDSVLGLSPDTYAPIDFFTPLNQQYREMNDQDLGSGGITILPNGNLLTSGKSGWVYQLNSSNLSQYNPQQDQSILSAHVVGEFFSSPTVWNNTAYFSAMNDHVKAFPLINGVMSKTPSSESPEIFPFPGGVPTISSNGNVAGVLWIMEQRKSDFVLRAYNAANLTSELYSDVVGPVGSEFKALMVANSRVYVPGPWGLAVYGLK